MQVTSYLISILWSQTSEITTVTDTNVWIIFITTPTAHVPIQTMFTVCNLMAVLSWIIAQTVDPLTAPTIKKAWNILNEGKTQSWLFTPRTFVFVTDAPRTISTTKKNPTRNHCKWEKMLNIAKAHKHNHSTPPHKCLRWSPAEQRIKIVKPIAKPTTMSAIYINCPSLSTQQDLQVQ